MLHHINLVSRNYVYHFNSGSVLAIKWGGGEWYNPQCSIKCGVLKFKLSQQFKFLLHKISKVQSTFSKMYVTRMGQVYRGVREVLKTRERRDERTTSTGQF